MRYKEGNILFVILCLVPFFIFILNIGRKRNETYIDKSMNLVILYIIIVGLNFNNPTLTSMILIKYLKKMKYKRALFKYYISKNCIISLQECWQMASAKIGHTKAKAHANR